MAMSIYDTDVTEEDVSREESERVSVLAPYYDLKKQMGDPGSALARIVGDARAKAIAANKALIKCDPNRPDIIRALQWRVQRFWDLIGYFEEILEDGTAAAEDMSDDDRAQMQALLGEDGQQQKDI